MPDTADARARGLTIARAVALCVLVLVVGCRETQRASDSDVAPPEPAATTSTCHPLQCKHFTTSAEALTSLLELRPAVIAFGESHALRGGADVLTATERFGAEYLPLLRSRGASTLVVELINPPAGCDQERAAVEAVQKPVVERQDTGNQERFVQLGHRAKALRMVPLILEPTCADFVPVRQAGSDGVAALLELIASQTAGKLVRLAARASAGELVVAYGGAIHNDIAAEGEAKPFAFGAELSRATQGKYLAVDLIVPEFVGDSEVWKALPWYQFWPRLGHEGVVLIETKFNEFTLILERGQVRPPGAPAPSLVPSAGTAPTHTH